jgi:hypothetical protein
MKVDALLCISCAYIFYRDEKCFVRNLQRRMEYFLHTRTFSVCVTVFEITNIYCYAMRTFLNLQFIQKRTVVC